MLSNLEKFFLEQRATLSQNEALLFETILFTLHRDARHLSVPIVKGDTLQSFESSLLRLLINSREGAF